MLKMLRLILTASGLAALGLAAGAVSTAPAFAQGERGDEAPKQVTLTQQEIDSLIAVQPEMAALQAKAQQSASNKPDPKMDAKMEAIVKRHGFDGIDDFEAVSESVGIVMAGIDPETKTYVGPISVIKRQIAQVQADKSMPPKDKAEALKELKEALTMGAPPKPVPGNAELVAKNFDKLAQAFQSAGGGD